MVAAQSGSRAECADGAHRRARRRSGSETRQRTRQYKLSLLPQEEEILRRLADEQGLPNIQQYILRNFVNSEGF